MEPSGATLEEALQATMALERAVDTGDWSGLGRLATVRDMLLHAACADFGTLATPAARQTLERIAEVNRRVEGAVRRNRDACERELRSLRRSASGTRNYRMVSRCG